MWNKHTRSKISDNLLLYLKKSISRQKPIMIDSIIKGLMNNFIITPSLTIAAKTLPTISGIQVHPTFIDRSMNASKMKNMLFLFSLVVLSFPCNLTKGESFALGSIFRFPFKGKRRTIKTLYHLCFDSFYGVKPLFIRNL